MKIGVYHTNGKFAIGEKIDNVDRELIDVIDASDVWFFIKYTDGNIFIASRFDDVTPPDVLRLQRCVVIGVCPYDSDLYKIYKTFIKEFSNLLIENKWDWSESHEIRELEQFHPPKYLKYKLINNMVEGIFTEYPSLQDRLSMIMLADQILKESKINSVFYSRKRPYHPEFSESIWISSRRLTKADEKFQKIKILEKAIKERDYNLIEKISKEADFIDLVQKLNRSLIESLFKYFNSVIVDHYNRYPDSRSSLRTLARKINFEDYLKELEKITPKIQLQRTSIQSTPETATEPTVRRVSKQGKRNISELFASIKLIIPLIALIMIVVAIGWYISTILFGTLGDAGVSIEDVSKFSVSESVVPIATTNNSTTNYSYKGYVKFKVFGLNKLKDKIENPILNIIILDKNGTEYTNISITAEKEKVEYNESISWFSSEKLSSFILIIKLNVDDENKENNIDKQEISIDSKKIEENKINVSEKRSKSLADFIKELLKELRNIFQR